MQLLSPGFLLLCTVSHPASELSEVIRASLEIDSPKEEVAEAELYMASCSEAQMTTWPGDCMGTEVF